jgi:hypothetical protein
MSSLRAALKNFIVSLFVTSFVGWVCDATTTKILEEFQKVGVNFCSFFPFN